METIGTAGTTIIGMLLGGKKRSLGSTITKTRMATEARSVLSREKKELEDLKDKIDELEAEFGKERQKLVEAWEKKAEQVTEVPMSPKKTDISMRFQGLAWLPYYIIDEGGYVRKVRAFSLKPGRQ